MMTRAAPSVALLCVGSELLRGKINTHTAGLARRLAPLGLELAEDRTLGDDQNAVADAIRDLCARHAVVIVTGGLGPTFDDVSREAAAQALGVRLKRSPALLRRLKAKFRRARYRAMPPANARQADLLPGATALDNQNGTAPGQFLTGNGAAPSVLILLPGPPRELFPMLNRAVLPRLRRLFAPPPRAERHLHFVGIPESKADHVIRPILERVARRSAAKGVRLDFTILAHLGLVDFDVFAQAARQSVADTWAARVQAEVRRALADFCYGADDEFPLEKVVGDRLRSRRETIAVAESCTGGLLAARLTELAGSSDFMAGGIVAYANDVKIGLLGISKKQLRREGAVSDSVARGMAEAVRERFRSPWGVGITGIAGPGGGSKAKPVGLVYIAVAGPRGTTAQQFQFSGARDAVRQRAVTAALDLLRRSLVSAPRPRSSTRL